MTNRIMMIVAFAAFLVFVGILLWHIPRLDLGAVIVVTVALVLWDLVTTEIKS